MSDEKNDGKILIFNPTGFIIKMIFSIAMAVLLTSSYKSNEVANNKSFLYLIFFAIWAFVVVYFAASMFGFCLRAAGNYIIAVILMVVLVALLCAGVTWIGNKSEIIGNITGIALILFLVWLPINDIRKAILYIKNTVWQRKQCIKVLFQTFIYIFYTIQKTSFIWPLSICFSDISISRYIESCRTALLNYIPPFYG